MRRGSNRPGRDTGNSRSGGNIAGHHRTGTDTRAAAYIDIVDYAHAGPHIHIVANMRGLGRIRPYGRKLAKVHIVANHCGGIDYQTVAVLYVQAVADNGARRYKKTVAALIAPARHRASG